MADTPVFQFNPQTSGGRQLGVAATGPSLGISGGERSVAGFVNDVDTTDYGAGSRFPEFLAAAFEPKLAAVRQERARQGYTAALLGKSQQEIDESTPWYAKVFGPTPFQLGAEKFTADKATADLTGYMASEMPRLRTMSSEDVSKELWSRMDAQIEGGDPYTTAMISKSMMERMPALLDLHTKSSYAWQQETMRKAQVSAGLSQLAAFEEQRKGYSELGQNEAYEVDVGYSRMDLQRNLLQGLATNEYQDPASVKQYWNDLVIQAADNGYFSGIAVLAEQGLSNVMDTDDAARLTAYVDRKWAQFKEKSLVDNPDLLERRVRINLAASQGVGAKPTIDAINAFNKEYQAKFGYKPFYEGDETERAAIVSGNAWISEEERAFRKIEAEQERTSREAKAEADKEAAAAAKEALRNDALSNAASAFLSGQKALIDSSTTMSDEDKNLVVVSAYDRVSGANPALAAQVLVWNHANQGTPSQTLARRFQQQLDVATGGPINDSFRQSYALWSALYSGQAARVDPVTKGLQGSDTSAGKAASAAYFGAERNARMLQYHKLRAADMPEDFAYARTWGDGPDSRPTIQGATPKETKQLRESVTAALDEYAPSLWSRVTGAPKLTASGRRKLGAVSAEALGQLDSIADPDLRVKYAIKYARDNGAEVNGRFIWENSTPGQKTMAQFLGRSPDVAASVVDRAIAAKIKKYAGVTIGDDSEVEIVRAQDRGAVPVIRAAVLGSDATWKIVEITGQDMKDTLTQDATPRAAPLYNPYHIYN